MNNDPTTLIHAYLDGELSGREQRQLIAWLQEDQNNVDRFVAECRLHSELCDTQGVGSAVQLPSQPGDQPSAVSSRPSFIAPIIVDSSPTMHEPLLTSLFAPGGFLFSYTMSALIVGTGLLIGLTWKISHDQRSVVQGPIPRQAPRPIDRAPETPLVGRITGVADCQWADPATAAVEREGVRLGRKFALASGFIEITYDTGAKVILQGPASYTVESSRGGYLSLGKLTALVEKKGEIVNRPLSAVSGQDSGAKGERTANLAFSHAEKEPTASLAPRPSALFSVRTPTAIVTDLGTEFGVEVDKSGTTRSHVFRGKVELRLADGNHLPFSDQPADGARRVQLTAGESASVERGEGTNAGGRIVRGPLRDAARFVRTMPWSPDGRQWAHHQNHPGDLYRTFDVKVGDHFGYLLTVWSRLPMDEAGSPDVEVTVELRAAESNKLLASVRGRVQQDGVWHRLQLRYDPPADAPRNDRLKMVLRRTDGSRQVAPEHMSVLESEQSPAKEEVPKPSER